jgi:hypothetical protein
MNIGLLRSRDDIVHAGIRSSHTDIFCHCCIEQVGILWLPSYELTPILSIELLDRYSIGSNRALLGFDET